MHGTLQSQKPHQAPPPALAVAVRRTQWDRLMSLAGHRTHAARGRALGVDRTLAMRVGTGRVPPSTGVIAQTMRVLNCRFEDVFEIIQSTES